MKVDARFRQLRSWCCRSILFVTVLAMAFCLAVPFAGAQSTGGRIRGTVVDPSGGAVPAANVTLRNEATGGERTAQSSATGEYVFLEVPVGTYTMELQLTGFKKYLRKGVTLELNQILTLDITLQIGGSTEVVEVTGAPPVVDTTSTQLGAVVNERAVSQLPLNARDTYQLLQLQPGVQGVGGSDLFYGSNQSGAVSVNGGRGRSNNFNVNGGDGNDLFVNSPGIQPTPDSIAEFRKVHLERLGRLFLQALELCDKAGLVKLGQVAIDGTKVKADASRQTDDFIRGDCIVVSVTVLTGDES